MTLNTGLIWTFYGLSNFIGVLFDCLLIAWVVKHKKRDASDMFVASLAGGCALMSFSCGMQCWINLHYGHFYGGDAACKTEAIVHVSFILVQFFSVMFLSISVSLQARQMDGFRFGQKMSRKHAFWIIVIIWVTSILVTGLLSLVSPIYLLAGGLYCFFSFRSVAISGWLVPALLLALLTMFGCHLRVMCHYANLQHQVQKAHHITVRTPSSSNMDQHITLVQFKWRSTWFMLILLVGWISAAVAVVFELAIGPVNQEMATALGVGGVSFSGWVPLVYTLTSENRKLSAIRLYGWVLIPYYGLAWFLAAWHPTTYVPAMSTRRFGNTPSSRLDKAPVAGSGASSSGSDTDAPFERDVPLDMFSSTEDGVVPVDVAS